MKLPRLLLLLGVALPAATALSLSCSSKETSRDRNEIAPGSGHDDGSRGSAKKQPAIESEAQAAQVLLTMNDGEIKEGEIGASRASVPEVKRYAEGIVRDHTAANDRLKRIIAAKGIAPEVTPTSDRLKFDSDSAIGHFKEMADAMFDRAFVTRQLNLHRSALSLLDEDLAPKVKDPDLEAELPAIRSMLKQHQDDAQSILDGLPMSSTSSSSSSGGFADGGPLPDAALPDAATGPNFPFPDFPDAAIGAE